MDFSTDCLGILRDFALLKPIIRVTTLLWELPKEGWVKYKIDGASRGNPGSSSYAFCLRDDQRDVMYAEGVIIEDTNNIKAEVIAILQVAKHCSRIKHDKVIIQTDSLTMHKILKREYDCPWSIVGYVQQIWLLMSSKQVKFQHILREGNQLANFFLLIGPWIMET